MHVKGLELPGYEPRALQAMALGLAVSARGADHNRSGAYEADLSGELDRLDGGEGHVAAAIETEDRAAAMDSLILCKFLRGVFDDPWEEWAALLAPSPAGTSTATSCTRRRAASSPPRSASTVARDGRAPRTRCRARLLDEPLTLPSGREASLYAACGWTRWSTRTTRRAGWTNWSKRGDPAALPWP